MKIKIKKNNIKKKKRTKTSSKKLIYKNKKIRAKMYSKKYKRRPVNLLYKTIKNKKYYKQSGGAHYLIEQLENEQKQGLAKNIGTGLIRGLFILKKSDKQMFLNKNNKLQECDKNNPDDENYYCNYTKFIKLYKKSANKYDLYFIDIDKKITSDKIEDNFKNNVLNDIEINDNEVKKVIDTPSSITKIENININNSLYNLHKVTRVSDELARGFLDNYDNNNNIIIAFSQGITQSTLNNNIKEFTFIKEKTNYTAKLDNNNNNNNSYTFNITNDKNEKKHIIQILKNNNNIEIKINGKDYKGTEINKEDLYSNIENFLNNEAAEEKARLEADARKKEQEEAKQETEIQVEPDAQGQGTNVEMPLTDTTPTAIEVARDKSPDSDAAKPLAGDEAAATERENASLEAASQANSDTESKTEGDKQEPDTTNLPKSNTERDAAESAENTEKEAAEKASQEAATETKGDAEESAENTEKEAAEKAVKEAAEKASQEAATETKGDAEESAENGENEAAEKTAKEAAEKASQEAATETKGDAVRTEPEPPLVFPLPIQNNTNNCLKMVWPVEFKLGQLDPGSDQNMSNNTNNEKLLQQNNTSGEPGNTSIIGTNRDTSVTPTKVVDIEGNSNNVSVASTTTTTTTTTPTPTPTTTTPTTTTTTTTPTTTTTTTPTPTTTTTTTTPTTTTTTTPTPTPTTTTTQTAGIIRKTKKQKNKKTKKQKNKKTKKQKKQKQKKKTNKKQK